MGYSHVRIEHNTLNSFTIITQTITKRNRIYHIEDHKYFFPCGSTAQFWALAASVKVSVSFRLLDVGQSAGLLGQVISSS
jgi:hypothetical protein